MVALCTAHPKSGVGSKRRLCYTQNFPSLDGSHTLVSFSTLSLSLSANLGYFLGKLGGVAGEAGSQ